MQAIPASLRPLLTMSEILLSFAYLMAASISVHLRRNRGTPLRIHGRLRRARANEPDCLTCALSAFNRLVVAGRACFVILGLRACASKLFLEFLQLFVGKILEIDEFIACVFDCSNQFVQFQMNRFGVAVLRVLNQKYHQERDNGRGGVDDQLPRVGKMKSGTCNQPDER